MKTLRKAITIVPLTALLVGGMGAAFTMVAESTYAGDRDRITQQDRDQTHLRDGTCKDGTVTVSVSGTCDGTQQQDRLRDGSGDGYYQWHGSHR